MWRPCETPLPAATQAQGQTLRQLCYPLKIWSDSLNKAGHNLNKTIPNKGTPTLSDFSLSDGLICKHNGTLCLCLKRNEKSVAVLFLSSKNDYKLFLEKVEHQHQKSVSQNHQIRKHDFCVERKDFLLNQSQFSPKAVKMITGSIWWRNTNTASFSQPSTQT